MEHLISSKDMAQFVASGYLKYEDMVPENLSKACREEMEHSGGYLAVGTLFEDTWPKDTALGEAFRLPKVKGLIHSLVGTDPLYDHHGPHLVRAHTTRGPDMHQDSVIDFRQNYFDIQLSFFPVETTDEMGDRKSTRLNSSHALISYAVFCLKKKKNTHLNSSHTHPSYAVTC